MGEWVDGSPIDDDGVLPVGVEIEVKNAVGRVMRYLVGHINQVGGGCDDCPTVRLHSPHERIVRWRRVWTPES